MCVCVCVCVNSGYMTKCVCVNSVRHSDRMDPGVAHSLAHLCGYMSEVCEMCAHECVFVCVCERERENSVPTVTCVCVCV